LACLQMTTHSGRALERARMSAIDRKADVAGTWI
jgi:hypothetical protein